MAWTVPWQVLVGGTDVTGNMTPYLVSIDVTDKDGSASDTCRLVFDDAGGQCLLPPVGAPIVVLAGGSQIFEGAVDSTPWSLSRGGGRVLTVSAKGFDTRGKAKEGQSWHLDDATLADALGKAARKAGFSGIVVDPALGALKRAFWSPDGASFVAWGEKLAREMGATFKLRGTRAVFAKRGQGASAVGSAMPTVLGAVGRNVLSIDIDPSKGRKRAKTKRVRFFDRASATFQEKTVDILGEEAGDVVDTQRGLAADAVQATAMAEGQKADAEREAGVGRVEIGFDPQAQAEGTFALTGARPGIDGSYRITGVTHRLDRSGGATTGLDLAQPQGAAGKDTRTPTEGSAVANVPIPTPAPR